MALKTISKSAFLNPTVRLQCKDQPMLVIAVFVSYKRYPDLQYGQMTNSAAVFSCIAWRQPEQQQWHVQQCRQQRQLVE